VGEDAEEEIKRSIAPLIGNGRKYRDLRRRRRKRR
jgi:hypothetical protein